MVNQFVLSIQQIYLDNIVKGYKTHEYRLGTPKRRKVKVGDELILVSTTNQNYKKTVIVTDINLYPSWEEALKDRWEQDFKGIYSSLKETIKACEKFYSLNDIKENQIIVFTIKEK